MYTKLHDAIQVRSLMIEGMSVSSIERHPRMHHTTIPSLLAVAGLNGEKLLSS